MIDLGSDSVPSQEQGFGTAIVYGEAWHETGLSFNSVWN